MGNALYGENNENNEIEYKNRILVLYGSQQGNTKELAEQLVNVLKKDERVIVPISLKSMIDFDPEDLHKETYLIALVSTYTDATPPDNAKFFFSWLSEATNDWRVGEKFLKHLKFTVFGCGNSLYENNYNQCAKRLKQLLSGLGAKLVHPMGLADFNVARDDMLTAQDDFNNWRKQLLKSFDDNNNNNDDELINENDDNQMESDDEDEKDEVEPDLLDMEDLGKVMVKSKSDNNNNDDEVKPKEKRPMLTDQLRKNLTKQGYKLLGSHSAVKLCRWTKAMLRGRGGCYKHTFYGITSYQCMEMTPSLSCANKCVFCWRHHTNPVGKEWKWLVDEPEFLIEQSISNHQGMIKQMRGVPGVKPERFKEAFTVKHCALSLVGEPIMYPHINRFVRLLHEKGISSFLVTNAQFPDRIEKMDPVTQLYVSVDASTKESLKAVDRPLFKDFWERFMACLESLKEKRVRTVYRLTLVKSFNMDEIINYAKLIRMGMPTFIEIKGVTFCGSSKASNLTMKNVPFHEEVRNFALTLCQELGDDYEMV